MLVSIVVTRYDTNNHTNNARGYQQIEAHYCEQTCAEKA